MNEMQIPVPPGDTAAAFTRRTLTKKAPENRKPSLAELQSLLGPKPARQVNWV